MAPSCVSRRVLWGAFRTARTLSSAATRTDGSVDARTAILTSKSPGDADRRGQMPTPSAEADDEWRTVTGCMELPLVMKQRAQVLIRKGAGKERLGLARMMAKHRPERTADDRGLPFTRAMYSGERTPAGDAGAGLTLLADRLPAFYASALRPLIELRKRVPGFVPRTVLLHGAGIGAAAFAVRHAWPDHRPEIVAVEPHGEFARIGQQLTSGMAGLTWLSHQKTSASQTSPAAAHQPAGAQKRQKGVPGADYGELDLGTFSAEDARKVAEARAIDDARAIEASNPYARLPKLATADATSTHGTKGSKTRPSWDMVADDTPSDRTAVNQIEAPIQGDAPAPAGSVPKGGWDLILCSFAFAEKDVGSAAESRHLKEAQRLWKECGGSMIVVEAGTPTGFANVEHVRALLLDQGKGDCHVLAPCPHNGPCPLSRRSALNAVSSSISPASSTRAPGARKRGKTGLGVENVGVKKGGKADAVVQSEAPLSKATGWCHFSQRVSLPSFQKAADGGANAKMKAYMDWKFSFVALARKHLVPPPAPPREAADAADAEATAAVDTAAQHAGERHSNGPGNPQDTAHPNWGRVLRYPMKRSGHVILDLCTAHGDVERRIIAKSHGATGGYRTARRLNWGDAFPHSKLAKVPGQPKSTKAEDREAGATGGAPLSVD